MAVPLSGVGGCRIALLAIAIAGAAAPAALTGVGIGHAQHRLYDPCHGLFPTVEHDDYTYPGRP